MTSCRLQKLSNQLELSGSNQEMIMKELEMQPIKFGARIRTIEQKISDFPMKRWDVFKDGKGVDGLQAREHSEAMLEALRKLDLDDE